MSEPVLDVRALTSGYGDVQVLRRVDLRVEPGTVAALLGPNGAGKTTLLRTIAGVVSATAGEVFVAGADVTRTRPSKRARAGVCLIPEGRGVYANLSVAENLRLSVPPWLRRQGYDAALDAFPVLKSRLGQRAGSLSGGQQQMLALSRCFLSRPSVVLLDEVSMGLAPKIIDEIFAALRSLADTGVALLLVEQYVHRALEMADQVHLMSRGTVTFSGSPTEVDEATLQQEYLGETQVPAEARSVSVLD